VLLSELVDEFPVGEALFTCLLRAVSAFCNATVFFIILMFIMSSPDGLALCHGDHAARGVCVKVFA